MINIVIPMAGASIFYDHPEYLYPKPLVEIQGKMMLERVVNSFAHIKQEKRFIFIINETEIVKFHLDGIVKLVAGENSIVVKQSGQAMGALCSILLAVSYISTDDNLIISNCDQVIITDLNPILQKFKNQNAEAGVICFESVHPKWSYARESSIGSEIVIELAEKRPISKNAIAGFYFFKSGYEFVEAAKKSISRGCAINYMYFIAPCLNELILEGKLVQLSKISNADYFSFYTPNRISEYTNYLKEKNNA